MNNERTEKNPAAHSEKTPKKSINTNSDRTPKNADYINNIEG